MLNYWNAPAIFRHHVESVNSRRAQYRVETFIIYDCSFRASFTSIVGLCTSGTNGPARNLGKFTWCPVCVRQEQRYHLVDSDIFTRDGYQNGPGDRHLRQDNREDGERKIVTAKDFEFSPRKESAAESTLPFPPTCACIMHAQWRCEKNVLAAAKHGVQLSLFASLSPFLSLCMRRYQSCIKCAGVCVCRYRGVQMCATLLAALIVLVRFFNNDISCRRTRCQEIAKREYRVARRFLWNFPDKSG